MQPHALKTYLSEMFLIRSTGAATDELSFYGPLANLLSAAGQALKPRVRCFMNLKNQGAGMPDGGLFTPDQFQQGADEPLAGQHAGPRRHRVQEDQGRCARDRRTPTSFRILGDNTARFSSRTTAISCCSAEDDASKPVVHGKLSPRPRRKGRSGKPPPADAAGGRLTATASSTTCAASCSMPRR